MPTLIPFSPEFDTEDLSIINEYGTKFPECDLAAINGPTQIAGYGLICGRSQVLNWSPPENIDFRNGQCIPHPYRPWQRIFHDPFPVLPYYCNYGYSPVDNFVKCIINSLCFDQPYPNSNFDIAHKGDKFGWIGRSISESYGNGHWSNWENCYHASLLSNENKGDLLDWWNRYITYLEDFYNSSPNELYTDGHHRNSHSRLVRLYLIYKYTGYTYWQNLAAQLANFLITKALKDHVSPYNHPYWVYILWKVLGEKSKAFIINGDGECNTFTEVVPLVLAGLAAKFTGEKTRLERQLPKIQRWLYSYCKIPGMEYAGNRNCRSGDAGIPHVWPYFKKQLLNAGITTLGKQIPGFYPISLNSGTIIRGSNLQKLTIHTQSYDGDAHGWQIKYMDGPVQKDVHIDRPPGQYENKQKITLPIQPNDITIKSDYRGKLFAPISDSPDENCWIIAGETYEINYAFGTLTVPVTNTKVEFEIIQPIESNPTPEPSYFYLEKDGVNVIQLWHGKDSFKKSVTLMSGVYKLRFCGSMTYCVRFTVDKNCTWRANI